ncbi:MAG: serine hydrolase [Candidatus Aminicenantales bacterium]
MKIARMAPGILAFSVAFALIAAVAAADESTDKVDKLFTSWDKTTSPGAALAVVRDGRIIYKRGYGMAKIEDGIVMTPDKIFDIGSVSKQFTATCVVMLVRDGKVSLDDNVRKYIPELPDYGMPITVRHLLHHTSGLRDYNDLLELAGFRGDSDCPNVDEALDVICRQKKLNYPPGQEYSYTNTGFFLLSQIVERVSGKSLNAFAQERIFKPLGMEHTIFQDDHTQIIKNRATGYEPTGQGFRLDMSNWDETGDGNIYTSVEDLYLWDQAFYTFKLGKDVMDMLHTKGTLNDGKTIDYAFGLVVTEYKGLKVVEHGGSWAGFRAGIVRFPDEKFTVICLANLGTMDPSGLCFKVAEIYLAGKLKEPAKKEEAKAGTAAAPAIPEKDLAPLVGNYQEPKFGQWLEISLKDGKLIAGRGRRNFILVPVAPTAFELRTPASTVRLEFTPQATGQPGRIRAVYPTRDEVDVYVKAAPLRPLTPALLNEYAGTYVSPELLDVRYGISLDKDKLIFKMRAIPRAEMKAMAPDKFIDFDFGANIEFLRGKGGKVTGFRLAVGRAAGIEFVKK